MRYIGLVILSQKNQKSIDMFFQESIFLKFYPVPGSHQTKPNQPEWYITTLKTSCESPTKKNFRPLAQTVAEIFDQIFEIFENAYIKFFWKTAPKPP